MSDIGLGLGIIFDTGTLQSLNQITQAIQNIQNKVNGTTNNFNKVNQSTQQLNQSMAQITQRVNDIRNSGQQLVNVQENMNKKGKAIVETYKHMDGTLTKIKTQYDQQNNIIDQSVRTHQGLKGALHGIGSIISHNTKKMLEWAASGTLIYGTLRLIQNAFKTMSDMEMAAVNIGKVLPNLNNVSLKQLVLPFEENAIQLAKQYGQSVLDVEKAMSSWARRYKEVNQLAIMTRASLLAATSTDIDFEQSVTALSAIMSEWNFEVKQSIHLVDMLNEVSNNYKVTAGDVADALSKTGSGARAVGLNIEQLTGVVVTGIQSLGMAGDEVGTMWTRVMARMRANKSAKEAIQSLGIDAFASLSEIMDDLMVKWDFMTSQEKQNFAITVAGTQHWSRFLAILDNSNTVIEATAKSYFSIGSAQKEVDNVMMTLQKHVGQLSASWQEYIYRNSGLLNIQKGVVDSLRYIINGLAKTPPIITVVIIGITALTAAYFSLRNAFLASNLALGAFTKSLLMNPYTAIIAGLTALIGLLFMFGKAASSAEDALLQVQIQQEKLNQSIEDNQNIIRGIDDMSKKYEKLQNAIKQVQPGSQAHANLTQKLTTVQNEMAKALGLTNEQFLLQVSKDGSISQFSKNRIEELVKQINLQRELQWEMQQMQLMQGKPQSLSFLMNFEQVKSAMEMVNKLRYDRDSYIFDPKAYKSLPGNDPLTKYTNQKFLNMLENSMATLDDYSLKNNKNIKELEALYAYTQAFSKGAPKPLTVDDILSQSITSGKGTPGDPDETKPTINAIFTNLTEAQVDMIKKIGEAWEQNLGKPFKQDVNKYVFSSGKMTQFSMSSEIRGQLEDIFKPLSDVDSGIRKAMYDYDNKIAEMSQYGPPEFEDLKKAQTDVGETYKKYIDQIDESKFKLQELQKNLDPTSKMYQSISAALNMMDNEKVRLLTEMGKWMSTPPSSSTKALLGGATNLSEIQPAQQAKGYQFSVERTAMVTGSLNAVADALKNLGGTAGIVSTFITDLASNFDRKTGTFDISKSMQSFGFNIIFDAIGRAINDIFNPQKYEAKKFNVNQESSLESYEKMNNFLNFSSNQSKYTGLVTELNNLTSQRNALASFGASTTSLDKQIKIIKGQINELEDALNITLEEIKNMFGVSIADIASSLESAFQATNYMDFLSSWSTNLEQMTRNALVKAFLSTSEMQSFYQGLSDKIWNAMSDGTINGSELSDIKTFSHSMDSSIRTFYNTLNSLGLNNGENGAASSNGSGGGGNYQAGSAIPVTYNNYVDIHTMALMADEDQARNFANLIARYLNLEEQRA